MGKTKIVLDALKSIPSTLDILVSVPLNEIIGSWNIELKKWGSRHNFKIINKRNLKLENLTKYNFIICDEIHDLSDDMLNTLSAFKDNIIGMSGSLNDFSLYKLYKILQLRPIYTYSIEQGIKDGIISNFQINIVTCNLSPILKTKVISGKTSYFQTERKRYNSLTMLFEKARLASMEDPSKINWKWSCASRRANFIYNSKTKIRVAQKITNQFDRCLIFTTRIKVAEQLADSFTSKSKNKNYEKFVRGDIDKLAVAQKLSMGVTIPNLKVGIFHQIRSSDESAVQKVLRMCNLEDGREAQIFICMYSDTVDQDWVRNSLNLIPSSKVNYIDYRNL